MRILIAKRSAEKLRKQKTENEIKNIVNDAKIAIKKESWSKNKVINRFLLKIAVVPVSLFSN